MFVDADCVQSKEMPFDNFFCRRLGRAKEGEVTPKLDDCCHDAVRDVGLSDRMVRAMRLADTEKLDSSCV